ncbi:transcriptional regulator [Gracilinema caldarium]|uniref:transcriptional regulator n=1 Tax=Gracilinema caldarium TaxID=215591 RepID=UPI0026EC940D|nr:transcriptional regulator [Gracilinema caldarium]MCA1950391.1 transcriptional regulator [Treponema sp.]
MSDDIHSIQASEDFSRARGKAILSRIQNFMNPDKDKLLSFNDVKEILKPRNETYKGMQVVPLELIVGSEGRYRDFNKYFLPRSEHLRQRWERVDMARLKDIILPPIQLYEIGGVYFVRDGNHRVSVARAQGSGSIDAEVISLSSEIKISPDMTTEQLKQAVIDYEKKLFYEKTNFYELTGCDDLDFSVPGRYDVIYNHILVHKYYLNEHASSEISFSDALVSWYNNVYKPIIDIIQEEHLDARFPGRTPSDLYVWIVKHWDFLKKKYGVHYSMSEAARDFTRKYGKERLSLWDYLQIFFKRFFE